MRCNLPAVIQQEFTEAGCHTNASVEMPSHMTMRYMPTLQELCQTVCFAGPPAKIRDSVELPLPGGGVGLYFGGVSEVFALLSAGLFEHLD